MSTRAMIKSVDSGAMKNSPITRESIRIAQDVWGITRPYLQGKSRRRGNEAVELNTEIITPLPPEIINNHSEIVIGVYIMFANTIPFLTTISRVVRFGFATEMTGANMENVVTVLQIVNAVYKPRGFIIVVVAADNGFSALRHHVKFIEMQI